METAALIFIRRRRPPRSARPSRDRAGGGGPLEDIPIRGLGGSNQSYAFFAQNVPSLWRVPAPEERSNQSYAFFAQNVGSPCRPTPLQSSRSNQSYAFFAQNVWNGKPRLDPSLAPDEGSNQSYAFFAQNVRSVDSKEIESDLEAIRATPFLPRTWRGRRRRGGPVARRREAIRATPFLPRTLPTDRLRSRSSLRSNQSYAFFAQNVAGRAGDQSGGLLAGGQPSPEGRATRSLSGGCQGSPVERPAGGRRSTGGGRACSLQPDRPRRDRELWGVEAVAAHHFPPRRPHLREELSEARDELEPPDQRVPLPLEDGQLTPSSSLPASTPPTAAPSKTLSRGAPVSGSTGSSRPDDVGTKLDGNARGLEE